MSSEELLEARREARRDAIAFVVIGVVLRVLLAMASLSEGWQLVGVDGRVWLALSIPDVVLILELMLSARVDDHYRSHRLLQTFLSFVVLANFIGLALLVAALLTEKTADLSGAQLLWSGAVVWLTSVIVFGLWFWTLDCGGPVRRALHGRDKPDFEFPQDDDPRLARGDPWYPRLEDYVYVAFTNGLAFSPTDTMPMTRLAKGLMAWHSLMSVIALLLVAARAVNVLGA